MQFVVSVHELWHYRLGHPSFVKPNMLHDSLNISHFSNKHLHCNICHLAKQRHLPFPSLNNISSIPFTLVHCDIWGPFHEPTVEGFRYFLTLVDDCSRATWVYLLKTKSDAKEVIPKFFTLVNTQFEAKIKNFRSNNAPELQFLDFFASLGVTHYHSCVETPQQNSVFERKHQHLLNVARALMFQAHLPLVHWGDFILTVAYLINCLPSPLLSQKSPFEVLYNKKPSYTHLRAFGCLCFASTSPHRRSKFSPRTRATVFLGYPPGYKGYKLLDLDTHEIFISRHVLFHEMIFPFSKNSPSSQPDIVSDRVLPYFSSSHNSSIPSTKKSQRVTRPPAYLSYYHCYLTQHDQSLYPLSHYLCYDHLSPDYKSFILNISMTTEPTSYYEVVKFPHWCAAMNDELRALEANYTWTVMSLPSSKHIVGCRWVYKITRKADGTLERYKARLIAEAYTQQHGIGFLDTFSPIVKLTTIKLLLVVAVVHGWFMIQLDINNAFLHGGLSEEVYMDLPLGYHHERESLPSNPVFRLHKSLYGLKQASRQWYAKFSQFLLSTGFKQSATDHSMFIKRDDTSFLCLLVYVDDTIVVGNCSQTIESFKQILDGKFKLKDLGDLKFFLGLEVARSYKGFFVCQRHYALQLLTDTGLLGCKPAKTPMKPNLKLSKEEGELLTDPMMYRRLIGKFLYLIITRPDLSFSIYRLSQFMSSPRQPHLLAAHRIL